MLAYPKTERCCVTLGFDDGLPGQLRCYHQLTNLCLEQGDYAAAEKYLAKSREFCVEPQAQLSQLMVWWSHDGKNGERLRVSCEELWISLSKIYAVISSDLQRISPLLSADRFFFRYLQQSAEAVFATCMTIIRLRALQSWAKMLLLAKRDTNHREPSIPHQWLINTYASDSTNDDDDDDPSGCDGEDHELSAPRRQYSDIQNFTSKAHHTPFKVLALADVIHQWPQQWSINWRTTPASQRSMLPMDCQGPWATWCVCFESPAAIDGQMSRNTQPHVILVFCVMELGTAI